MINCNSYSQDYSDIIKVAASDRETNDEFGYSVCISGNYAIVGAPLEDQDELGGNIEVEAGSAYIYERDLNGNWDESQKIVASDRASGDYFGQSVSISGNYAVIGAVYEAEDAAGGNTLSHAGSAYIYERDVSGNWNEVKKIVPFDRGADDRFGQSVCISDNYIIVGAYWEDEDTAGFNTMQNAGSAYVFERDQSGVWNQKAKLVTTDRAVEDYFGYSVAIFENYAIVGAFAEDEDEVGGNTYSKAGSAYIFKRDGNGKWLEVQKIVASDRNTDDIFGTFVDISGEYAIVGAPEEDEDVAGGNTIQNAGSAYIFERDAGGTWNEVQKIVATARGTSDFFGYSVSISENHAIVGANWESEDANDENTVSRAGSAYIFERNIAGSWETALHKIAAPEREEDDFFGRSVSISGDYAIVGAYYEDEDILETNTVDGAGSAYIFEACDADFSSNPINVIENGNFETCILSPWNYYVDIAENLARYLLIDGTCILIPDRLNSSPEMWHIQLEQILNTSQRNMLVSDDTYTLSFSAWAEVDNMPCHIYFGQYNGANIALLDESVDLDKASQEFSFDFTMNSVFPEMKLALEIGTETTWAGFDNVSIINKSALDITDISDENNIKITPNPATNHFKIFAEEGSNVAIYNSLGQLVKTSVTENAQTVFQTDGLDAGIYVIKVQKGDSSYSSKLIIY